MANRPLLKGGKCIKKISVKKNTVRFRVEDPKKFQKSSFRNKDIGRPGFTQATIGRPKGKKTTKVQAYWIRKKDLGKMKDSDGDKVPDSIDCAPMDPKRQGKLHDALKKVKQKIAEVKAKRKEKRRQEFVERKAVAKQKLTALKAESEVLKEEQKIKDLELKAQKIKKELEKGTLKGKAKEAAIKAGKFVGKEIKGAVF